MVIKEHNMLYWRNVWQAELSNILSIYLSYKKHTRLFFLQILIFFFLVNALCYWLAVYLAFPELLQDLTRTFKIQLIVALMGGLFDSLSFFITIWLIRKASRAFNTLKFFGILSVDLIVAALATAWVLLVVLVATWLVNPENPLTNTHPAPVVIEQPMEAVTLIPPASVEKIPLEQTLPEQVLLEEHYPIVLSVDAAPRIKQEGTRKTFYHDIMVSALNNPLENARYFLFAVIMGVSTLLPTLFHIVMGFRTLILSSEKMYLKGAQDYVEGFVTAVPTQNKAQYLSHITQVSLLFKKYGALKYVECWGDEVPTGEFTSFPQAVQLKEGETVVFSWITWPSKAARDEGIQQVMQEYERLKEKNPMPFDRSRMIHGGFEVMIDV